MFQPLKTPPSFPLNVTQTIYKGTSLEYEDRELDKFTTCEYVVSVFNEIGNVLIYFH